MEFDYLFYIAPGTEAFSPSLFEKLILDYTPTIFKRWHELDGFVVWHGCGHVAEFIKSDYYDQCMPGIFETLSQPPVGNISSLS